MSIKLKMSALVLPLVMSIASPALAQADNEQYLPGLTYRTGPYAVNGAPYANGFADYIELVNRRDGGINGVKIFYEECETGYATDRGVECYERMKGKGSTGAPMFHPGATGIAFALTDRAPKDQIPIVTVGYGRSDTRDGTVFPWNFPLLSTHWTATAAGLKYLGEQAGGMEKLKGKKIALVYIDAPAGKEPIPVLEEYAKRYGFELMPLPITPPGLEQKSQWLQVRQQRPDYLILWGWGVLNSTALQEAAAVNYPREKILGYAWSGAEPDVRPAGDAAVGYTSLMVQHGAHHTKVHEEIKRVVYDAGAGKGKPEEVGEVLYNRGLLMALFSVEAIRTAQAKYGNKPMKGSEVRWGLENLDISADDITKLGIDGMIKPLAITCSDHEGARFARVHRWDGKTWNVISDWIEADDAILEPLVKASTAKYAKDNNIQPVDCSAVK